MKVWKDKTGKWIDAKEFAKRFSEGVQEVSPIQQAKVTLIGQCIVIVGIILGLFINGFAHIWWLFIILCGSLFVAGVSTLGAYQKYKMLKKMFSPEEEEKLEDIINQQTTSTGDRGVSPEKIVVSNQGSPADISQSNMKGGKEDEVKIEKDKA